MDEIANNLVIPKFTLYTWVQEYKEHGEESFPGSGSIKPCNEELYRLCKELADVKQDREILFKRVALSISGQFLFRSQSSFRTYASILFELSML